MDVFCHFVKCLDAEGINLYSIMIITEREYRVGISQFIGTSYFY
jgi:hypothetical protein